MCLKGVWGVFGWLWIIPNNLTKFQWRTIEYCFNWLVPFLSIILDWPLSGSHWVPYCEVSVEWLEYVWEVSWVKSIDKNPIRVMSTAGSFSPRCFGMSEGCLEDVWEVSWCCLSDSGYCFGGYDVKAIDKHPVRLISIILFLFLPVA